MAITKLKHLVTRLLGLSGYLVFIPVILSGCSSEPTPKLEVKPEPVKVYKVKVNKQNTQSSQYFIQQAQQFEDSKARHFYIQAVRFAIREQRANDYIEAILEQINPKQFGSLQDDIELAKAYLFTGQIKNAELLVNRLKRGVLPKEHQKDLWIVATQLESAKQEHIKAIQSVFRIYTFYPSQLDTEDKVLLNNITWQHILKLPQHSLEQFSADFGPLANVWLSLAQQIKLNFSNPTLLTSELARWKNNNHDFIQSMPLPRELTNLLSITPFQPKRIALLLPLTGSLAQQATLIRNGFIAAMDLDETSLSIIDTSNFDLASIEQQLVDNKIDFVVGPLTKENVEKYSKSDVSHKIPSLLLNQHNESIYSEIAVNNFFFALSPEDEINQAIEFFIAKGVNHPAIIYADNSLGRRLANHFEQSWLSQTNKKLETIAFKNKSKLGVAVKDLLDVSSSNKRIKEMKGLFGPSLETESRSRKDIDAVYVIANSQQTRLIKPFFDVNVSTFGERLPIYASSRSYLEGETSAQKRDLNGLLFTEMPWLIRKNHPSLDHTFQQLETPQTQFKKLFAFGYDAHQLIFMLQQLNVLQNYSVPALTGNLSLTPNKVVKRDLTWSKYQQGSVVEIISDI